MAGKTSAGDNTLDLFAPRKAASQESVTVTQLNNQARQMMERQFSRVVVIGEISDHKVHSGHHYFGLRDSSSQIPAVLFRREASHLRVKLRQGMEVTVTGKLTIYGPRGRYQLVADRIEPRGAGALQATLEALKKQLLSEGLFAQERKKPLPLLPRRIAIVTSPTGAVIRDIVNVGRRRFPGAHMTLVPVRVQGLESAAEIAEAVARADRLAASLGFEVIIVARGGGSLEDLWGFNDEAVVRAVAAVSIPIVSAVGHETDFSLCDFAADVRAPTPSAAAELVFPDIREQRERIATLQLRAHRAVRRDLERRRFRLTSACAPLRETRVIMREQGQRLALARADLDAGMRRYLASQRAVLAQAEQRIRARDPRTQVSLLRQRLDVGKIRLRRSMSARIDRHRAELRASGTRLQALSPTRILGRGYSIVLGPSGQALTDASEVQAGETIDIRLSRGHIEAQVQAVSMHETDSARAHDEVTTAPPPNSTGERSLDQDKE